MREKLKSEISLSFTNLTWIFFGIFVVQRLKIIALTLSLCLSVSARFVDANKLCPDKFLRINLNPTTTVIRCVYFLAEMNKFLTQPPTHKHTPAHLHTATIVAVVVQPIWLDFPSSSSSSTSSASWLAAIISTKVKPSSMPDTRQERNLIYGGDSILNF